MKKFRPVVFIALFILVLASAGCEKTPTAPSIQAPKSSAGVYIVNEGGFQHSDASLTYYDFDSDSSYADVFRSANGRGLGDIANDMKILNHRGYIVVNNSDRIEVVDITTNRSVGTIVFPARKNPGFITLVDETRGFCANYDGTISTINPSAFTITRDSIGVVQFPGGIASAKGKVYVSDAGFGGYTRSVSVFDGSTGSYLRKIDVGFGPGQMSLGSDGKLYIICGGINDYFNPQNTTDGALFVVDPATDSVTDSVHIQGNPYDIAIDANGAIYTRGGDGVIQILHQGGSFTVHSSFLSVTSTYAIGIDDTRDLLFVTRLANSSGSGEMLVCTLLGSEKKRIPVGIFPGTIVVNE